MAGRAPRLRPDVEVPAGGLTIGEAAAALGLGIDTLRYWEREGLTAEPAGRTGTGQRRYTERDLEWLAGVVTLRRTGMPIRDIRAFAALTRRPGTERERLEVFEAHRERVLERLRETRGHLAAIDRKIAYYRDAAGDTAGRHGAAGSATTEDAGPAHTTTEDDTP
ncbi:MerR family transcriptional regulator [Streptomyces sp. SPB074]|uniref:MerR family transcriptional regulator n=1 Tax=Streptomyces sp. (strain SPB074) TaxID=465543 RepID=UPI000996C2F8|nr:MerR family transcriptional regulator [Streptomyces sp. SPB074]